MDEKAADWKTSYGNLIAGSAALLAVALAAILCLDTGGAGRHGVILLIKPGQSALMWTIFSVTSMITHFCRPGKTGTYVNPVFGLVWNIVTYVPFLGLVLSGLGQAGILENGAWKNIVVASSTFLDSLVILLIFTLLGTGLANLKSYFTKSQGG